MPNGTEGGQLIFARGIAANRTGNGAPAGSVYVAEANANHRISQFSADCSFIRTWGYDVIKEGAPNDNGTAFEICDTTAGNQPSDCKAGLTGGAAGQLANPAGVAVDQSTGYVYITSVGNRRVDIFSGEGEFVGAFGYDVLPADPTPAGPDFCTVVTGCQPAAAAGPQAGRFSDLTASSPAVDPNIAGKVLVPDRGNLRVAEYRVEIIGGVVTAVSFERAFGWGVDTGAAQLESCTIESECQTGTSGNGAGQFATGGSPTAAAVDGNGFIYVTSGPLTSGTCSVATPCRIQKFAPDAASALSFGPASGPGQLIFTAGAAQAVAGINLAVDPENGHVFVLRKESTTTYRILEYDSNGVHVESHPSGPALDGVQATVHTGITVGTGGRIYANYGSAGAGKLLILGSVPPAEAEITSVQDVTSTSARFEGVVTVPLPGGPGFEAKYHFEYSSNGVDWESTEEGATGSDAQAYPVAAAVGDLSPNTQYQVRLVARTGAASTSQSVPFRTSPSQPRVALSYVEDVTSGSAKLAAHIDPEGLSTRYHFEWSSQQEWDASAEYKHRTPSFDRSIGAGNEPVIVQEEIVGLDAGAVYRFRVVAENRAGERTEGDAERFETLNSCGLTDGRCYELVSPADKRPVGAAGDIVAIGEQQSFQVARNAEALVYPIAYGLADATAGGEVMYESRRAGSQWRTAQISVPALAVPENSAGGSELSRPLAFSSELECGVFASLLALTPDAPRQTLQNNASILYTRDSSGTYRTVTNRAPISVGGGAAFREYVVMGVSQGAGEACKRVVFATGFEYPGVPGAGAKRLYEWEDGNLRNVGEVPGPDGQVVVPAEAGASRTNAWNAVSVDATRIFFTAQAKVGGDLNQNAVFLRDRAIGEGDLQSGSTVVRNLRTTAGRFAVGQSVQAPGLPVGTTITAVSGDELVLSQAATSDGALAKLDAVRTIDVSQSQNPAVNNNGPSRYEVASEDGGVVYFTARYGLAATGGSMGLNACAVGVEDAPNGLGCDLYAYEVDSGQLRSVSTPEDGTANPNGASVAGVLGVDEDGSHVYFAARGQLIAGKGRSEARNLSEGSYNVYLATNDGLRWVGLIGGPNANTVRRAFTSASLVNGEGWTSRVTPDGQHLLFESALDLVGLGEKATGQAYLYDAATGRLRCVSCRRDGSASINSGMVLRDGKSLENWYSPPVTLSEDGRRVFFISRDGLATGATEGRPNLYQWKDGQITFLAKSQPGVKAELQLVGASADGASVYFTTIDQLTWQDWDGKLDVYVARPGGGVPEPVPSPVPCDPLAEGGCQGQAPGTQVPGLPASASVIGGGNVKAPSPAGKKKKSKKSKQKKRRGKAGKNGRTGKKKQPSRGKNRLPRGAKRWGAGK